jgi:hypothetical protein
VSFLPCSLGIVPRASLTSMKIQLLSTVESLSIVTHLSVVPVFRVSSDRLWCSSESVCLQDC